MLDKVLEDIINGDASLRGLFMAARVPRYRYWQASDGAMFVWTTERFSDGKFGSAVLVPTGPGARSGRRKVTSWRTTREVHVQSRALAKARALRLFKQHELKLRA